jgi:hypothetical protein
MSLGNFNFDDITENDLKGLVDAGVPEGFNIEYKRDCYGNSDSDKKEVLKDISSFANSFGGHLIIGIEENKGLPIIIRGLQKINPDAEVQRLENLIRDGIEPRITGIKIKTVSIASGDFVIVIRIPRSWNPPHRVRAGNVNRFYVRNSSGVHEVSVEELRALFNLSATTQDRIQAFRRERLAILSADEGPMKIEHEGRLILHLVPLSAFGHGQSLDVKNIFDKHSYFRPISSAGMNQRFNLDGVINFRGGDKCYGYTQIFRTGIIEATKSALIREQNGTKFLPGLPLGRDIFEVLPGYLEGLKILDVPPPFVVMISLQELYGASLAYKQNIYDFESSIPFNKSELILPEILIEDYGSAEDYQKRMRPAFDAIWNAAGYAFSGYFNEHDIWVGK